MFYWRLFADFRCVSRESYFVDKQPIYNIPETCKTRHRWIIPKDFANEGVIATTGQLRYLKFFLGISFQNDFFWFKDVEKYCISLTWILWLHIWLNRVSHRVRILE